MIKNRILLIFLHWIMTIGFWFTLFFCIVNLGYDLFTKDGKLGSTHTNNHHSLGYSIPITLKISIPDSIVEYKNNGMSGSMNYYRNSTFNHNPKMDSILQLPNTYKSVIKNEIHTFPNKLLINPEIITNGHVIVKSPKFYINLLQMMRTYISIIVIILIFYQLMKIFKHLLLNFSFTKNISKRVTWLGLIFISFELFKFFITLSVGNEISNIMILSTKNNKFMDNAFNLDINPHFDFDFTIFIVGLSLLVLSSLLKIGTTLENENKLTI